MRTLLALFLSLTFSGCFWRIDLDHVLIRSDVITSLEQEKAILEKATLTWTEDKRIRVLYARGTPYERGYQHGALLRDEVQDNLLSLYDNALSTFKSEELFDEAFERMRPYISQEYIDEMHGLAHGSRIPLRIIHAIHALPELTEWGGKKRLKEIVLQMMSGDLGTSCSNIAAKGPATYDTSLYTVRVLDWGLHKISKLHEYPLITVNVPESGIVSANIGWVGFLGAVSGINAEGITLGEMGYGSPENETLRGTPMTFLLRDILRYAHSLKDVREIISQSPGSNSYVFLMSDGKNGDSELYVRDHDRFEVHKPGAQLKDAEKDFPAIKDIVYGGHYDTKMYEALTGNYGTISPELLMSKVIPEIAMKSNFQNIVYLPAKRAFWVANAASKSEPAWEGVYSYFELK